MASNSTTAIAYIRKLRMRVSGRRTDADARFDVITLFDVIEHLRDPFSTLRSLADLLADSGLLAIDHGLDEPDVAADGQKSRTSAGFASTCSSSTARTWSPSCWRRDSTC
jgi:hypothetical protein